MSTILKPFKDNILFQWLDGTETETVHSSGIILTRDLRKDRNRWGIIIAVGPLSTAKVGEYILPDSHVEAYGAKHPDAQQDVRNEKTEVWRVRDENVLLVTSDYMSTMPLSDSRVHTKVEKWEDL